MKHLLRKVPHRPADAGTWQARADARACRASGSEILPRHRKSFFRDTASRMESHGEAGRIQVSEEFVRALHGSQFVFEERAEIEVKGKGMMKTYFLALKA